MKCQNFKSSGRFLCHKNKLTEVILNLIIQDSWSSLDLLSTGDVQGWSLWPDQTPAKGVWSVCKHIQG